MVSFRGPFLYGTSQQIVLRVPRTAAAPILPLPPNQSGVFGVVIVENSMYPTTMDRKAYLYAIGATLCSNKRSIIPLRRGHWGEFVVPNKDTPLDHEIEHPHGKTAQEI